MPTTKTPLLTRIARKAIETKITGLLAEADDGSLLFAEICLRFPGQPISDELQRLVDQGEIERFEGCAFHITALGRARLEPEPPVCLSS